MPKKVTIDCSVLLAILLAEEGVEKIVLLLSQYNSIYISPLTYFIVYYKLYKGGFEISAIHELLSNYKILEEDATTVNLAKLICKDTDFEDAIQIACSLECGVDLFLTRDERQFKRYKDKINLELI